MATTGQISSLYKQFHGRAPSQSEISAGRGSSFSDLYKSLSASSTTAAATPTPTKSTPTPTPMVQAPPGTPLQVVPGAPNVSNQMNVADYGGQIVGDPSKFFTGDNKNTASNESMMLSDRVPGISGADEKAGLIDGNSAKYGKVGSLESSLAQATAALAGSVVAQNANTYKAQTTQKNITDNAQMHGATGQVDPRAVIEAPQIDSQGTATGTNADGSVNHTGKALNEYAKQGMSQVIDTSTPAGKALAGEMGDGNYVDSKSTVQGQLALMAKDFVDPVTGEPQIPSYAAGMARGVSKIIAFKGMSGSAATAAMSQALMEASLPIAQQDAQFFQTLTISNLNNKQTSIINKANVLAKMDLANLDSRMAAAVENSKNFMQMDLANLSNKQQARIINTQARVQSILEDAKAVNTERLFTAESKNDMQKFYAELDTNLKQFNASQTNAMRQFNASERNDMGQFNAELENNRQQFYKTMQYNIDTSNAKWRQTVTLTENQQKFEAAAADVKNMVGVSVEQLNQLWDRNDALLDYLWKSSENDADRKNRLMEAKLAADSSMKIAKYNAKSAERQADSAGWGAVAGAIAGPAASAIFGAMF